MTEQEHQMPEQLTCEIVFKPEHNFSLQFIMEGARGVVVFTLWTQWSPDMIDPVIEMPLPTVNIMPPLPADVGYHTTVPMYDGQKGREDCEFLPGRTCYYDGSTLAAGSMFTTLLTEGSPGVWRRLAEYYDEVFAKGGTGGIGEVIQAINDANASAANET